MRTTAPAITPATLPIPPKMTMTRMIMEMRMRKLDGKMEPTLAEKMAPLNEASTAPTTKAMSLALTVFTPMVSATVSSSRMAIQARPSRDRSSRHEAYTAKAQKTITRYSTDRGSVPLTTARPNTCTPGMLVIPWAPPNHPDSQSDKNSSRMISPKPRVTMAR